MRFSLDYAKLYQIFKKLPFILGAFILATSFILGFVFGIAEEELSSFLVPMLVGIIAAPITAFFTALSVSPMIVIADSFVEKND